MSATMRLLVLALIAGFVLPAQAQQDEGTSDDSAATPTASASTTTAADADADDALDDEWLNTIWTQVDDMVKEEEHKLQETVTVAGVRGAEAQDSILDRLYYKGAKRYPSQDKLNKAIETLRAALKKSPRGDKAPMQIYFVGQCYEKLGRLADARTFYEQVTKDHANTTWAKKARTDLDRLATR